VLRILQRQGDPHLAEVFIAELRGGARIEFVESVQPPLPRSEKWVLIISMLKGCPVGCPICDAGGHYRGRLTAREIMAQIDYLIRRRYPDGRVPVPKLKIQFARMGDPAFNDAILTVLRQLPRRFALPGLMPCVSTIAPTGREDFFEELLKIKRELYPCGRFQMQFSLHTTDDRARRRLIPAATWSLEEIAAYGERFFAPGDRKITLNFAPARGLPLQPERLRAALLPDHFLVKLTPINPTRAARHSELIGLIDPADRAGSERVAERFRAAGYETLISIGELRENEIGSNCGMYAAQGR
jgi:23S rRNA (adenine2503-C2)-methyltransferase